MAVSKAATARLNDPNEHFPYKKADALAVLRDNAPAGPEGPDDDRATARDFISEDIIEATDAYITAQAEWLKDPSETTRANYVSRAALLVEARKAHRSNRPNGSTVTAVRSPL